jgi:hypothetical protein
MGLEGARPVSCREAGAFRRGGSDGRGAGSAVEADADADGRPDDEAGGLRGRGVDVPAADAAAGGRRRRHLADGAPLGGHGHPAVAGRRRLRAGEAGPVPRRADPDPRGDRPGDRARGRDLLHDAGRRQRGRRDPRLPARGRRRAGGPPAHGLALRPAVPMPAVLAVLAHPRWDVPASAPFAAEARLSVRLVRGAILESPGHLVGGPRRPVASDAATDAGSRAGLGWRKGGSE